MNLKLTCFLLLLAILLIDRGDAWGRRRRRGSSRRRSGWFRRTIRKVGGFYKKHKGTIHSVVGGITKIFGGWDQQAFEDLQFLKEQDADSYDEFQSNARKVVEDIYPEEDMESMMEAFNDIADLQQGELKEFMDELKSHPAQDQEPAIAQLQDELKQRVESII